MANFNPNQTPSNGADHIHNILALIAANGGTGASYGNGTAVVAGVAPTVALQNGSAWGMITLASGHQWCFQRHPSNMTSWRITMSPTATLSAGTGSQAPSSNDRVVISGGGTEESPVFSALLDAASYRAQYYVGNTAPYGFYAMTYPIGGGTINSAIFQDPLITPATDPDPFVYCASAADGAVFKLPNGITRDSTLAFYLGASFVAGNAYFLKDGHTGSNVQNGNYDSYALGYGRPARYGGASGFKGWSRLFQWSFTQGLSTPGDGVNVGATALALWTIDDATAKWDLTTIPIK